MPFLTPCNIRWTGPKAALTSPDGTQVAVLTPGTPGVLVYPGLVAWSPDLALLYRVDDTNIEAVESSTALGGWDGTTVTAELVGAILQHDDAIPTLVEVMNSDESLGPKVVQGVMAGMAG
jgi:hypothetical protein